MNAQQKAIAHNCLEGAEGDSMTFPQIVGALIEAGFESYTIDFRRSLATYYLPDGDAVALPMRAAGPVMPALDQAALQAAISEAQKLVAGYTYRGFCSKAMAAGCAGYMVSFSGRRAVYFSRAAETHTEIFPDPA